MDFDLIAWDDDGDEQGNVQHIAEHGVTPEEVEDILEAAFESDVFRSQSSGRPAVIGETSGGRTLIVIYEIDREGGFTIIRPVTAYDIEDG
jgi:uncharacterized DUF497 family protein